MNKNLLKLAKMVLSLAEVETDKAKLIIEGEPEVGKEVFIEDENGELVAPEDGEYEAESQILVIAEGKIAEVRDKAQEGGEAPAETPEQSAEEPVASEQAEEGEQPAEEAPEADPKDEKDKRIAELEAKVEELNNIVAEKDEEIGLLKSELEKKNGETEELKSQLKESDAKPAEELLKSQKEEEKKSWFKPRY